MQKIENPINTGQEKKKTRERIDAESHLAKSIGHWRNIKVTLIEYVKWRRLRWRYPIIHSTEFFFFINLFFKIYLFLAVLVFHCCAQAFTSYEERGLLLFTAHGLLIACLLLLQSTGCRRTDFSSCGVRASEFVAHGLCCSEACGIFPDQGPNPYPLHWQTDS